MKAPMPYLYRPAVILTVSLFFLWGMANNLNDILIAHFRRVFTLTDFQTSFVQQAFYLGYFLFALPAALLTRRAGYKSSIVAGLSLYAAGALLFYPAAELADYRFFLAALFVIASGLAFLETSASPLIAQLGDEAGAARRLNLAQAANPIGTISGVLIGKWFILSRLPESASATPGVVEQGQLASVVAPYVAIGLVALAFAVAAMLIRFPDADRGAQAKASPATRGAIAAALADQRLRFAVLAQFLYVGAQVGLWSFTIRYARASLPELDDRAAADYLFAALVLFSAGRIVGSVLLGRIAAPRLLAAFAAAAALLTLTAAMVGGRTGLFALTGASFFMSVQFPTIFALGMERLGGLRQIGASLLVMAIIGGAAITAVMGWLSDASSINTALIVPSTCFLIVLTFAWSADANPWLNFKRYGKLL